MSETREPTPQADIPSDPPGLADLFFSFLRLGAVSFGGPAMVVYIRDLAVHRRHWLSADDFQDGVALCQAVPGATAMQSAAYVGFRVRGLAGAVATYAGFGLPAFSLMLMISIAYRQAVNLGIVTSVLTGLRALVVALVANAVWTFGRSSVKGWRDGALALATAALFLSGVSPFLIVAGAGLTGVAILPGRAGPAVRAAGSSNRWHALRAPAIVLAFAAAAVAVLFVIDPGLANLGLLMMKVDIFAFGGGFASLPLMFTEVVSTRGWLPAGVFLDGIALGQVTPGPIVITATFVGYQMAGIAGAVVGTAGILLPSIFVVVLVEPWFRRLRSSRMFQSATRAFILSFVGLLASVTIQFGRVATWSVPAAMLAALALVALLRKVDVVWVVLAGAVLSALIL